MDVIIFLVAFVLILKVIAWINAPLSDEDKKIVTAREKAEAEYKAECAELAAIEAQAKAHNDALLEKRLGLALRKLSENFIAEQEAEVEEYLRTKSN